MMTVLTLVAAADADLLSAETAQTARDLLLAQGKDVLQVNRLGDKAVDLMIDGDAEIERAALDRLLEIHRCDWAAQPLEHRAKSLLIADMDSTIIKGESLDDVAALAGIGPAIAAITDRAMRGELDFAQALAERLSLLADEPVSLFETVLAGLELSPGAQTLVATMRQNGAYCALVSGGLEPLVGSVAKQLGFHECHANGLDIANGRLTGKVKEPVFGPDGKRETLRRLVKAREIGLADTLAVGDGANDIPMLRDAGLGVAYHGKPATVAAANHQIRFGDLTTLLYFQGFRPAEFVTPTD